MSSDLFIPIKFKTNVILLPNELDLDFEKTLLKKIKDNYENICSKYGYIKKNSIKIIKRTIGLIKNQHFNGNTSFSVLCLAEICNPIQGSIIKCKVKNINKMGVLAEGYYDNIPILEIIIPSNSAGIKSEINLETLVKGQEIKIEVCGKKYQLFDKHISIIGRAIKNKEEFIKNEIKTDYDDELNPNTNEENDDFDIYEEEIDDNDKSEKSGEEDESDEEDDDDSKKSDINQDEEYFSEGGEEFNDELEDFDNDFKDD
jgi:DNA-directed RNA polymerase subunit E'/Rpb7